MAQGKSETQIREQLQARVPDLNISHDPGGMWDWLIGLIVVVGSTGLLLWVTSRLSRWRPASSPQHVADVSEEDDLWNDRLDDELINVD